MRIVRARPTAAIKAEEALEMMRKKVDDEGDVGVVEDEFVRDKERNILCTFFFVCLDLVCLLKE